MIQSNQPTKQFDNGTRQLWQELSVALVQRNNDQITIMLAKLVAHLDEIISEQLSEIIQYPKFKQLESSWTNLQRLIDLPVSQRRVKLKLLDISWEQLSTDLNLAFDMRQTSLYKKIYSSELDTAGGTPFGLVVIDHKISPDYVDDSNYDDLYTLQLLSEVAERSLCPFVLSVDDDFFGDEPSRQLHDSNRINRILESSDFHSWSLLRENVASRFLHLTLPDYLLREPYKHHQAGFIFSEVQHQDNALWGNSAYLLATNVIREFDRISWFGFLRSYDSDGDHGAIISKVNNKSIQTKVDIFGEEDGFWGENGFVPLTSLYLSDQKGFFSNQSVWHPPTDEEQVLGMLQTNLMACRFGHYIKAQTRDQIGGYDSVEDCKRSLERWLQKYISELDYGEDSVMARYPLKSSEVIITPDPNDSTRYHCQISLQPQYQYELIDVQVVLSTSLSNSEVGESA
ncbi:type VI secretion system contractile sheath large subunit [Shewanella sp. OPT22]|nr:type VI secretion system contractile sheath large subunit [Shewanella sp. OPT22]